VFRLVAEAKSMTSAAKTLGESIPTVSRRINDLERELGTKLFDRSKRGVELTPSGRNLIELVQKMQCLVDRVGEQVAQTDTSISGSIKIKSGDGIGPHWMARFLPNFHRSRPNVQIDLEIGLAQQEVIDREADLAIVFEKPNHPDIISQRLGTLHYICFASSDYLKDFGVPETIFDMQKHKLLMHTDYVHQLERWSKSVRDVRAMIDYATITNSGSALVTLCENGGGIAVLPSYIASYSPKLTALTLPPAAPIDFWITYTEPVRRSAAGIAALEWLLSIFNEERHPYFGRHFIHPNQIAEPEAPLI
jgi:DNA-binding transcriptional LysR family regulator